MDDKKCLLNKILIAVCIGLAVYLVNMSILLKHKNNEIHLLREAQKNISNKLATDYVSKVQYISDIDYLEKVIFDLRQACGTACDTIHMYGKD